LTGVKCDEKFKMKPILIAPLFFLY
jgi:hypothetical protein